MEKKAETQVAKVTSGQVQKIDKTPGERFSDMVIKEFAGTGGKIAVTAMQQRMMNSYFISLDGVLQLAEEKRIKKSEAYRDKVPISWANINMPQLAQHVVACARIGLDPMLPNQLFMIPYKNNTTGKYDINFRQGYRGKEIKAKKYGLEVPDEIVIELVYKNDKFEMIKKDKDNPIETYSFKVADSFDRGEVVGGFWYHKYLKEPSKNKVVAYTKEKLLKYKPDTASPEFWGGAKDNWVWDEDKKKNVKKGTIQVEGWEDEMLLKTLYHRAYDFITIDSQKIDDDFIKLSIMEHTAKETLEDNVASDISQNANQETIEIPAEVMNAEPAQQPDPRLKEHQPEPRTIQENKEASEKGVDVAGSGELPLNTEKKPAF